MTKFLAINTPGRG